MRLTRKTKSIAGILLMAIISFSAITKIYSAYIETTSRPHVHNQSNMKISQQLINEIDSIIVAKKLMEAIYRGDNAKQPAEYTYLKQKVEYMNRDIRRFIPHGLPESEFNAIVKAEDAVITQDMHKRPSFYKKLLVSNAKYLQLPVPEIVNPQVFGPAKATKA